MSFLVLKDATKFYAGARALAGAHLKIAPGEVHALMGENGAGKSTLIKILAGITVADRIDMSLDGIPAIVAGTRGAFAHGFRFIHQELNIIGQLSVAENIVLGRRYPRRFGFAVDWRALHRQAAAALARLQVSHIDIRAKMARLSTGDQMLVKIAALLVADGDQLARLYVMDEPTAALTGGESDKLFAVIGGLRASGASVLYVSHRISEVMDICDRVTVFRDGQTVATKALADTSRNDLIHLMTGRKMQDAYPPRRSEILPAARLVCNKLCTRHITDISFTVAAGEVFGVAGLANSGQGELLQALLGIHAPRSGSLTIGGAANRDHNPGSAWRSQIAYIPRERRREGLMLRRPIIDNIALPHLRKFRARTGLISRRRETRHAAENATAVRLKAAHLHQPVYQLSGGNQQKVMLARAIGDSPQLLLLDEPTRGVDVGAKFDIYTLIRERSAAGAAVIVTSSDLPELIGMCDRILVLRNGVQHAIVPTSGLTAAALLAAFYD